MESFIGDTLKELKLMDHSAGYLVVKFRKDGKYHDVLVHRLVLTAFVGPCPPGKEGCHRDGDKRNNRVGNLYWGTRLENMADQVRHGTTTIGERNARAILTEKDVKEIMVLLDAGWFYTEIADRFKVCAGTISAIARGKTWKHATGGLVKRPSGHWSSNPNAAEVSEKTARHNRGRKHSEEHKARIAEGGRRRWAKLRDEA